MPLLEDIRAVKSVGDTADNRLDDIEWLRHELGNASPGHESDLMRLLLSRVTLNNMFQFCALLDAQGTMWERAAGRRHYAHRYPRKAILGGPLVADLGRDPRAAQSGDRACGPRRVRVL
jgi:hypothetical protein